MRDRQIFGQDQSRRNVQRPDLILQQRSLCAQRRQFRSNRLPLPLIVLSSNGGRVEGAVTNDRLQPMAGVEAVLVPDEARDRPELFKTATTDANGHFTIPDVAPRDYRLFAWEGLEPFGYFDPDFLKRFDQKGTPIRVSESSRQTVNVRMIPLESAQ